MSIRSLSNDIDTHQKKVASDIHLPTMVRDAGRQAGVRIMSHASNGAAALVFSWGQYLAMCFLLLTLCLSPY